MGRAYEGSFTQKVVEAIRPCYKDGMEFTIDFIINALKLPFDKRNHGKVLAIIGRLRKKGAVEKVGMAGRQAVYKVVEERLLGPRSRREMANKKGSEVKHIKPIKTDVLDRDISFSQLGEAVYKLLVSQSKKINKLNASYIELTQKMRSEKEAFRETLKRKDQTIEELNDKVAALTNRLSGHEGGTFKLGDVVKDEDRKVLNDIC